MSDDVKNIARYEERYEEEDMQYFDWTKYDSFNSAETIHRYRKIGKVQIWRIFAIFKKRGSGHVYTFGIQCKKLLDIENFSKHKYFHTFCVLKPTAVMYATDILKVGPDFEKGGFSLYKNGKCVFNGKDEYSAYQALLGESAKLFAEVPEPPKGGKDE